MSRNGQTLHPSLPELAAKAQQDIIDLQIEREQLTTSAKDWETYAHKLETERDELKHALEIHGTRGDKYYTLYIETLTRLRVAGKIVLDVIDINRPAPEEFAPRSKDERDLAAVIEGEIVKPVIPSPEEMLPLSFLQRGHKEE